MKKSVENLTVAVTGAARGIGAATAVAFAARGARVCVADIDEQQVRDVAELEHLALARRVDVTDPESFAAFLAAVETEVGPLDVLVNNAGIMPTGSILSEDDRTTRRIVDINLHGVITGTKLALRSMVPRRSGHVVNLVSMAGENYAAGVATYCASKYGALGFTDSVRVEMRRSGVSLSAILPAFVNTDLISGTKGMPGVGVVEPEEVAAAIVRVVERPRAHVYVPRRAAALLKVSQLLPRRVGEALQRRFGTDTMFFDDLDADARRAYEERVREL